MRYKSYACKMLQSSEQIEILPGNAHLGRILTKDRASVRSKMENVRLLESTQDRENHSVLQELTLAGLKGETLEFRTEFAN